MRSHIILLSFFTVCLLTACEKPVGESPTKSSDTSLVGKDNDTIPDISNTDSAESIQNIRWKLIGYMDTTIKTLEVTRPDVLWIYLNSSDSTIEGETVSNILGGCYKIDETISYILISAGSTKRAELHPEGVFFLKSLRLVDSFSILNNELQLYYNNKQNYLLFERR